MWLGDVIRHGQYDLDLRVEIKITDPIHILVSTFEEDIRGQMNGRIAARHLELIDSSKQIILSLILTKCLLFWKAGLKYF